MKMRCMSNEDEKLFSLRCRELRKASGMTQDELAVKVGVKRKQAVSNWENGNSMPSLGCAKRLAQIFGVSLDYLVGYNDNVLINVANLPEEMAEIVRNTAYQLEKYHKKQMKNKNEN